MAYTNSSTAPFATAARSRRWIHDAFAAAQRWQDYRRTLRELSALSPRELADIGLNPAQVERTALEAVYGARSF